MGLAITARKTSSAVRSAFVVVALTAVLAGCSARLKSSIKDCENRANHQSPTELLQPGNDPSSYMERCMVGRGYRLNLFKNSCQISLDSQSNPGCYSAIRP
jgi:hypothetical protein